MSGVLTYTILAKMNIIPRISNKYLKFFRLLSSILNLGFLRNKGINMINIKGIK